MASIEQQQLRVLRHIRLLLSAILLVVLAWSFFYLFPEVYVWLMQHRGIAVLVAVGLVAVVFFPLLFVVITRLLERLGRSATGETPH